MGGVVGKFLLWGGAEVTHGLFMMGKISIKLS